MQLVLHSIGRYCCHPETSKLSTPAQPYPRQSPLESSSSAVIARPSTARLVIFSNLCRAVSAVLRYNGMRIAILQRTRCTTSISCPSNAVSSIFSDFSKHMIVSARGTRRIQFGLQKAFVFCFSALGPLHRFQNHSSGHRPRKARSEELQQINIAAPVRPLE